MSPSLPELEIAVPHEGLLCSSFRREGGSLQCPVPWTPREAKQALCKCAPLEAAVG